MSQKKVRRHFTTEQKAALVRRHLVDKASVAELCEEHELQPSVFYEWQRKALENLGAALEAGHVDRAGKRRERELEGKLAQLESKLASKDSVIAEISAEYVALKKGSGEL